MDKDENLWTCRTDTHDCLDVFKVWISDRRKAKLDMVYPTQSACPKGGKHNWILQSETIVWRNGEKVIVKVFICTKCGYSLTGS